MRVGRFPGQEEALLEALRKERLSRRRFFILSCVAACGGLGVGYAVGRSSAPGVPRPALPHEPDANWNAKLAWARSLARGEQSELIKHHLMFCTLAELFEPDATVWLGIDRLARAALELDRTTARSIAERVLVVMSVRTPPPGIEQLRQRLQEIGR